MIKGGRISAHYPHKVENSKEKMTATSDFKEVNESYTLAEAVKEAQRCLHCKVPSCRKGCPISNDIPDWIAELAKGNFGNAMRIINNRSNLPAVCGRVCGHERQCEGNCVLAKREPISISENWSALWPTSIPTRG